MARKTTNLLREQQVAHQKIGDMNLSLPGRLERNFRQLLGRHHVHLGMLELSAQIFADSLAGQSSEAVFIRECAKKQGFHTLHPHKSFASARSYLVYSHIAYVFSAGDVLCENIRSTDRLKRIKTEAVGNLSTELNKGDFVRKTLALTLLAGMPAKDRTADAVSAAVEREQLRESFALVNYYRLIRNEELHTEGEMTQASISAWETLPRVSILDRYGRMPSAPADQPVAADALLCSQAWQDVAKWLCRHMWSDSEVQALIKKRFGNRRGERRSIAVRRYLALELLHSTEDIETAMASVSW